MPGGLGMLSKSLSKTCSTRLSILERCQHPPISLSAPLQKRFQKQVLTNPSARDDYTRRDKHFGLDRINIGLLNTIYGRAYCPVQNLSIAETRILSPVITQCGSPFSIGVNPARPIQNAWEAELAKQNGQANVPD